MIKSHIAKNTKTAKHLAVVQPIAEKSEVMAISDKLPGHFDVMSTTTAGEDKQSITMIKRFKTKSEIMEQENVN